MQCLKSWFDQEVENANKTRARVEVLSVGEVHTEKIKADVRLTNAFEMFQKNPGGVAFSDLFIQMCEYQAIYQVAAEKEYDLRRSCRESARERQLEPER